MKSVVEGECGRSNALVSLAKNYGESNSRISPSTSRGANAFLPQGSLGDAFAMEFLAKQADSANAPTSFDMKSLSRQLTSRPGLSSSSTPIPLALPVSSAWANEFASSQLAAQWAEQMGAQSSGNSLETAWRSANSPQLPPDLFKGESGRVQPQGSMWSAEFLDSFDTSNTTHQIADEWSREFTDNHEQELWRKLEGEWAKQREDWKNAGLESEHEMLAGQYEHVVSNPFLSSSSTLSLGDSAMRDGDIEKAILAYEAATQQDSGDADAWCKLGLAHAENEHDDRAIQAFRKALHIQPNNEEALLSLSVSLANECLENDALEYLERWLKAHTGRPVEEVQRLKPSHSSFLDSAQFDKVEKEFLSAAATQAGQADCALQNALGVLYNLGRNFDRAIDSLRLAIQAKPDDARLWNRLGATLANGERTAEAISAYREALRLYPSYVRARYNIGISCMHLSSYREAVEHFTSALELQKGEGKEHSSIWQPLRSSAMRCLDQSASLIPLIDSRDLSALRNALNAPLPWASSSSPL